MTVTLVLLVVILTLATIFLIVYFCLREEQTAGTSLTHINQELNRRGLSLMESLGDSAAGTEEIIGIERIIEDSVPIFTDMKFKTRKPDGTFGFCTIRFYSRDGAVFVVLVNEKWFALVRQWRLGCGGRYTVEVPRGFGDPTDGSGEITLRREFKEEVLEDGEIENIIRLGASPIMEMSGTHNTYSNYYLLKVKVPENKLDSIGGTESGIKVLLWTRPQVEDELTWLIRDQHSLVAMLLALRHIDRTTVPTGT